MKRKCASCHKIYDDAVCWTICPHNSLDVGVNAPYCKYHDLFNCYLCDHSGYFDYREQLGEYECPRERELHELRCWKQDMLEVESELDTQTLARMLGGVGGESSRAVIQREVPKLLQRCTDLRILKEERERQLERCIQDLIAITNIASVRILADQT